MKNNILRTALSLLLLLALMAGAGRLKTLDEALEDRI